MRAAVSEPRPFPTPLPEALFPTDPGMRRAAVKRETRIWAMSLTVNEVYVMRADHGVRTAQEPSTPAAARMLGRLWRRLSERGLTMQEIATMREDLLSYVASGIIDV